MEEISHFVGICWPLSRTRTPYFGKRGVTAAILDTGVAKICLVIIDMIENCIECSFLHCRIENFISLKSSPNSNKVVR